MDSGRRRQRLGYYCQQMTDFPYDIVFSVGGLLAGTIWLIVWIMTLDSRMG